MQKIIFIISAALLTCCLGACKTHSKATGETNPVGIENLAGKYWKLIEIDGNPVENNSAKEPHIILELEENRFHGNAGCNVLAGSFQSAEPGRITFSQVVATRMMCIDMEIENKMLKLFDTVDSYTVKDDTLTLTKDKTTPLARFVAVELNN